MSVVDEARKALDRATPGRAVQFHPSYCEEAEGTPFSDWDTSHDLSVIRADGSRYKIGHFRHAADAMFDQWCRNNVAALIARTEQAEAEAAAWKAKAEELDFLHHEGGPDSVAALEAEATALRDEVARLREALAPFDRMAGAMFARNWNKDGVAISFVEPDGPIRLTFADFLAVRSVLHGGVTL